MCKIKKKSVKILVIIVAVLILLPVILIEAPVLYNNAILLKLRYDIRSAVKDTEGVEFVDSDAVCGNLNGNGNKMQFLAAVIVRCEDERLITECLKKTGRYDKDYVRLDGKKIKIRHLEHDKLDLDVTSYSHDDNMYLIYISSQPSYASNFDLRAH